MPLYELTLLARTVQAAQATLQSAIETKNMHQKLLKSCALHVLDKKGVVRQFQNLGERSLPYRMKRHQQIFDYASYYSMTFDCSPRTMIRLQKSLKLNENVIRHTVVKLGDNIPSITDYRDPLSVVQ
jgi:small subunit ribosomal protein S6